MDAERDRLHPTKRNRPVASGRLPKALALALAAVGLGLAMLASAAIGEPRLALVVGIYVLTSWLYSAGLKHVPGVELAIVASGFVLRAIGGAVATHVPPSAWFLTVCSLGALMVAIGKRYTELSVLGTEAAAHRPAMRWYRIWLLRAGQRAASAVMLIAYVLWALSHHDSWMRAWHLASALPLACALIRFDRLTELADGRPVEDLIARDPTMICAELVVASDVHGRAVMTPAVGVVAVRGLFSLILGVGSAYAEREAAVTGPPAERPVLLVGLTGCC